MVHPREDEALNAAFGIGRKLDPLDALAEVASALESAIVPTTAAAKLVSAAIRRCLAGTKSADRDLLAAAGWKNRRGGRNETPVARQRRRIQALAAAAAMAAAPGRTARERAEYVASHLTKSSELAKDLAEELRLAGFGKGTSARAIQAHAKRAGDTSI